MKKSSRTKQRILSIALALILMVSAIPTAFAANEIYSVEGMNSVPTVAQTDRGGYAMKNDGSLWAWSYGWAYSEQMGGVTGPTIEGPPYNTNSDFIQFYGDFGLKANGELYGWGNSLSGNPTASNAVKLANNIAVLDENEFNYGAYIALKTDGTLVRWNYDSNEDYSTRKQTAFSKSPEVLLTNVISYEVYGTSWWALKSDGVLWHSDAGAAPTTVMNDVAAFSRGGQTTLLAIKKDGTLWGWGNNSYGAVGNGGLYTRFVPQHQENGPYYYQDTPVKILDDVIYAAIDYTSFAITSDGTLYGWGHNDNNELGFTGGNYTYDAGFYQRSCQTTPKVITTNAAAVATFYATTIVLKRDGTLWSCGNNSGGAAGQPTSVYSFNMDKLTKMMDGVALPDGMVTIGTQPTPPVQPSTPPENAAFSDTVGHWANEYIKKAADHGLVNGVGNGKFEPDKQVTNAEWCQMVTNLMNSDLRKPGDNDPWWWPAVEYCSNVQFIVDTTLLTTGLQPGRIPFNTEIVNAAVNRYDMAQVIYNISVSNIAKNKLNITVDTSGIENHIADYQKIPTKYRTAVEYCYAAGFITGTDNKGTFGGTDPMNRGAAATVLCRLLDAVMEGGNAEITPVTPEDTTTPTIGEDELEAFADEIRQEFYILLNNHRIANGLRALEENLELQKYADIRAAEQRITFGHTRPDGTAAGSGWHNSSNFMNTRFAENAISVYWVALDTDAKTLANSFFTAWKESSGHNRHMLFDFNDNITMALGLDLKIESGRITTPGIWATGY